MRRSILIAISLLFLISMTNAYTKYDYLTLLENESNPYDFTAPYSIFRVCNPTPSQISRVSPSLQFSYLTNAKRTDGLIRTNIFVEHDVIEQKFDWIDNCSFYNKTVEISNKTFLMEMCYPTIVNCSFDTNKKFPYNVTFLAEICHPYAVPYNIIVKDWVPFDQSKFTFEANKCYNIKIQGYKKPVLGPNNIDVIPSFMGYSFPEYQWWNSTWNNRRNLTISSGMVSGTHTDFPLLIILDNSTGTWSGVSDNWNDIRFVINDVTLDYEKENYTTANATFWVRIPTFSQSTIISIYYNNSAASDGSNKTGVWNASYGTVQHFTDNTTSTVFDSSSNVVVGTKTGANTPIEIASQIFKGQNFTTSYITYGTGSNMNPLNAITLSAWIYAINLPGDDAKIIIRDGGGGQPRNYQFRLTPAGVLTLILWNSSSSLVVLDSVAVLATNTWYHVAGTYDGSTMSVYVNGNLSSSSASLLGPLKQDAINTRTGANYEVGSWMYYFSGIIDEVEIKNNASSSTWINASYQNQKNPSSFYSIGGIETGAGAPPVGRPTYSSNSTNTTIAGTNIQHDLEWFNGSTTTNVSGYIFSFCNGSTASQAINWTSNDQEDSTNQSIGALTIVTTTTAMQNPNNNTLIGGTGWVNPTFAYTDNGAVASAGGIGVPRNATAYWNFTSAGKQLGISIPNNADSNTTIQGIGVWLHSNCSSGTGTNTITVRVSNNTGSTYGQSLANVTADRADTAAYYDYFGGTAHKWGQIWNVTNAQNLYVNVTTTSTSTRVMGLDWVGVNITYTNNSYDVEANKSWVTYPSIGGAAYGTVDSVRAIVEINIYDPSGSNKSNNNNNRPDIEVAFYNGSTYINGSFCQINVSMGNNLRNTTAWNCTVSSTDAYVVRAWATAANRRIQTHAVWIDRNFTAVDAINVTAVYGVVNAKNPGMCSDSNAIMTNDSWTAFTAANCVTPYTDCWSNVTKFVNTTVGAFIKWCVYANDTSNNWNSTSCTSPFNYSTTNYPIYNVSWNYPVTNTWNKSQSITHTYTPTWADTTLSNCSLWTNKSGSWALAVTNTTLTSGTTNLIVYNYGLDSPLIWSYISCCNNLNNCNATANTTIKIDATAPSAVSGLTNNTQNSAWVNLTWTAATDTTSGVNLYVIYKNGTYVGNTTATRYNVTSLSEYSTYIFNVSAYDNAGNYGPNLSVIVLTNDVTAPGAPGSLTNASQNSNWIYLTWSASTETGSGVAKYLVYRNTTNIINVTTLYYNNTGLSEYSTYSYNVSAIDNYGNWGNNATTVTTITKDVTAPSAVGGLTNNTQADTWVNLTWTVATDSGSGISKYLIYQNGTNVGNTTANRYNATGLASYSTYIFNVSAMDNYGNNGSNVSVIVLTYDLTAPGAPGSLTNNTQSSTWVNLSWTASTETGSGILKYLIYQNTTNIANTTGLRYNATGLTEYSTYAFNVSALDNSGNWGSNSTVTTITKDVTAPSAVSALSNNTQADTWVNLTWTAATDTGGSGVAAYHIYKNGTDIGNTATNRYNATGLTSYSTYIFNVSAVDVYGNYGPNLSVIVLTYDLTGPTAPGSLTNITTGTTWVNISWSASTDTGGSGINKYLIYRNDTNIANTTLLSYNNTGLTASTPYNYTVEAIDNYGNFGDNATTLDVTTFSISTYILISECTTLNVTGNYSLDKDVNSSVTCFTITANNVLLDCGGYTINYSTTTDVNYGVYINGANFTTIINCPINKTNTSYPGIGSDAGISNKGNNNRMENNTITSIGKYSDGIYVFNGNNLSIFSNVITCDNGYGYGLEVSPSMNNSNIANNTISTTDFSLQFGAGTLINNTFTDNVIYSYGGSTALQFGSSADNNTFTGGSIMGDGAGGYDFILSSANSQSNNFSNINFSSRWVGFYPATSSPVWFTYSNQSYGLIWLKTSSNVYQSGIQMNFINWNNTNLAWSVLPDSLENITSNVTGLRPNANYQVWEDNSTIIANLTTDSYGTLSSVINLTGVSSIHTINVTWTSDFLVPISSCTNLTVKGYTYYLTADILDSSISTCMNITAANVTLDCQGHLIQGRNTTDSKGIYTNQPNTTIKNCNVNSWYNGVYAYTAGSSSFTNNTALVNNGSGFWIQDSNYAYVVNNTANWNGIPTGWDGFDIFYTNNSYFINNTAFNNGYDGLWLAFCSNNSIYNNTANNNSGDGIGLGYFSNNNRVYNSTASNNTYEGIKVYFSSNNNIIYDITTIGGGNPGGDEDGIDIWNASNNTIYNIVSNDHTGDAVYLGPSSSNNTVYNVTGNNNLDGIYLLSNFNNTVYNNTFNSNSYAGIDVQNTSNNTIFNNTINNNYAGFKIAANASSNAFYNNTANNNGYGILLNTSSLLAVSDNLIYYNIISNNTNGGFYVGNRSNNTLCYNNLFNNSINIVFASGLIPANFWNTTNQTGTRIFGAGTNIGGNYWTNSSGDSYSDTCTDADADGFCDTPLNLTSMLASVGTTYENNTDYLPLSNNYSAFVASYSFIITIPRGGTNYSGAPAGSLWFNSTTVTASWINPCTSIDLTGCQNKSVSIYRFWNTGNTNERWTMVMDTDVPTGWALFGNSTYNVTLFIFSGTQSWVVNTSIDYTSGNNFNDAWLWANVTNVQGGTYNQSQLNHTTTAP